MTNTYIEIYIHIDTYIHKAIRLKTWKIYIEKKIVKLYEFNLNIHDEDVQDNIDDVDMSLDYY